MRAQSLKFSRSTAARAVKAALTIRESISRPHESVNDAGFACSVARVADQNERRFRPGSVKIPGAFHRRDDVIAPLHDDARYVTDLVDIGEQLVVLPEKTVVNEVVTLDPGEGDSEGVG